MFSKHWMSLLAKRRCLMLEFAEAGSGGNKKALRRGSPPDKKSGRGNLDIQCFQNIGCLYWQSGAAICLNLQKRERGK
ncbi:MAG: hypothetical protein NT007_18010 [Candidatus Kapabacteria bacterium]|nr:hypothetical protein [Candidatus Kapabacteria bacterium]